MRLGTAWGFVVGVASMAALSLAACQQTFVAPERPDLYKPVHVYDLAVSLAEPGNLAVPTPDLGKPDLSEGD